MVIFDRVLEDYEELFAHPERGREGDAHLLSGLVRQLRTDSEALPALSIPEFRCDVAALSRQIRDERLRAEAEQGVPQQFSGLVSVCGRCKVSHYLGDAVADWWLEGARPSRIVIKDPHEFRKSDGFTFPGGLADRVATYQRLTALLR